MLGRLEEVVIPRSEMMWLVEQPDKVLSTSESHYDSLFGDYNFLTPGLLKDPYHEHVIHRSLARNLNDVIPPLQEEVELALDEEFGTKVGEWRTVTIFDMLMKRVIPRLTNRMLVGTALTREPGYVNNMVNITGDIVRNMLLLALTPMALQPIVGPALGSVNKYHFRKAAKHAIPVIKERLDAFAAKDAGDPAYTDWKPPSDYLSWHIALARAESRTDELTPWRIAQRLVPLNFAAIHTTTLTMTNAILDMLAHDGEQNIIAQMREEVERVWADEGGRWTKNGLSRLYRIDSAIRESQRSSAFAQTLVQKKVVAKEGVTNPTHGWHFEYGSRLVCPIWGVQHDRDLFGDNADGYDAFRFSREREEFEAKDGDKKSAEEGLKLKQKSLVTTSTQHFPFGHGRHAW